MEKKKGIEKENELNDRKVEKLVIIGSGPAAMTSALYAGRADLSPIVFEGFMSGPVGGQLMITTKIENFPGFPKGILGPNLMENFRLQAKRFGARMFMEDVVSIDLFSKPFIINTSLKKIRCHSLIIATGAEAKRLDVPGTRDGELWQKGVTACAICDGAAPIFRGKDLFVIGGGDSAVEEAIFLTKYAKKVFIVHRRDKLRASKIMEKRVMNTHQIEILWNNRIIGVEGKDVVQHVILKNTKTQKEETRNAGGVFFAIGHRPNTEFLQNQLDLTDNGYIVIKKQATQTSVEGVFAAGDVQDFVYRQAITAAASGCMAAIDAERYLSEKGLSH